MRTLTFLVFIFLSSVAFSQSTYEKAMKTGLDSLRNARSKQDYQNTANYFERIAIVENGEWLPGYYTAFCLINYSFNEADLKIKEEVLLKSKQLIEKMISVKPDESEIYVLEGLHNQAMIYLDFQNNAAKYSSLATTSFNKSIKLNENNPRPYSLLAMNLMNTPEAFGGGMKSACPLFFKADELFNKFQKSTEFMPDWGKDSNAELLKKCNQ